MRWILPSGYFAEHPLFISELSFVTVSFYYDRVIAAAAALRVTALSLTAPSLSASAHLSSTPELWAWHIFLPVFSYRHAILSVQCSVRRGKSHAKKWGTLTIFIFFPSFPTLPSLLSPSHILWLLFLLPDLQSLKSRWVSEWVSEWVEFNAPPAQYRSFRRLIKSR